MKIFLTGATGFLGGSLVALLSRDEQVAELVCLVRDKEKVNRLTRQTVDSKVKFLYSDILDEELDLTGVDMIIHAAAATGASFCQANPELAKRVNAEGTKGMVEKAKNHRVPYFVYVSSQEVYGEQLKLPYTEDMTLYPGNMYSLTKYAGERYVSSLAGFGLRYAIVRLSKLYGLGDFRDNSQLPHKYAGICCEGGIMPVCEGRQIVDFVHVSDACRLIYTFANSRYNDIWNEVYNGGGNEPMRVAELAELFLTACRRLGLPAGGINILPPPLDDQAFASRWLSIAKAKKRLGWMPIVTMEEGIDQLLRR